jgi:hypothetical protein
MRPRVRPRLMGATLTALGVLVVLFKPYETVSLCARGCHEQGSSDWLGLINYPAGWGDGLAWAMFVIGVALVVTGIVVMIRAKRFT